MVDGCEVAERRKGMTRVLHIEDNLGDARLVQRILELGSLSKEVRKALVKDLYSSGG